MNSYLVDNIKQSYVCACGGYLVQQDDGCVRCLNCGLELRLCPISGSAVSEKEVLNEE